MTHAFVDSASLHESAVQRVAAGETELPRRGRGPDKRPRLRTTTDFELNPEITKALRAANVPISHVQILGPDDIIIWNHPAPWPEA